MSFKSPIRAGAWALKVFLPLAVITGVTLSAPGTTESAKANGETRTIYLHHAHTKESIEATYLVDGQYDRAVLEKLNWFLRDWRRDEPTHMDPRLFDVVWTVYRESGSSQPIEVMSAYRSPETNAMLRRRSRQVAEHSQHILGKAMDQHYVDVPMSRIRELAMKLQRGGVGFYPTAGSPFVHMDVGGVRHWPRMSYDQLARLFPDGKTVHIPSNGQPLARYEEARAELEARGDSFSYPTVAEVKSKGFFAWLFGGGDEDEDAAGGGESPTAGRGRGYRDQAPGRQRVASLDPGVTASVATSNYAMPSKNGGIREFNASTFAPPPPSSAPGGLGRRTPPAQPPAADQAAQQRLADAMAAQQVAQAQQAALAAQREAARQAAAQAQAQQAMLAAQQAAVAAQQAADARRQPEQQATQAQQVASAADVAPEDDRRAAGVGSMVSGTPAIVPAVPMPPRRPIELAAEGPAAPLPPGRPVEFAALAPRPGSPGSIDQLLTGAAVKRAVPPAALLAYTGSLAQMPVLPPSRVAVVPSAAVPLPVARPAFVAARLDRSNFATLTGSGRTSRTTVRAGLGSAVSGLRPAARTSLGTLDGRASAGAAQGFSRRSSELAEDAFSGAAVGPRDHVVTSAVARRAPVD